MTIVDGIAFQYLWPNHPEFNKYSVAFASVNMVVSALLYARTFLLLHLHHPRLDKIIIAILILRIFTFLTELIFNSVFTWNPFWDWVILLLPFSAGILCYKDGFTPAKYYVVAFTSIFLGYLIFALSNRGIIISNYLTVYAINYAVVIEIILLSLALAERLKSFKIEKEQAQKDNFQHLLDTQKLQLQIIEQLQENEHLKEKVNLELEEKVEERTQELLKARAEIEKINQILNADNTTLKSDVKTLKKDRVLQKQVSFDDFKSIYFDDPACFQFLETLKWGNGFKCKQCNHFKYSKGNTPNSRRCSKCGFIESVMTGSVFSRLKFPLHKAFYLLFLVHYNSKITSDQLSEILDLRKQTCWAFKKKILAIKQMAKDQKKHINSWNDIIPLDIPENF